MEYAQLPWANTHIPDWRLLRECVCVCVCVCCVNVCVCVFSQCSTDSFHSEQHKYSVKCFWRVHINMHHNIIEFHTLMISLPKHFHTKKMNMNSHLHILIPIFTFSLDFCRRDETESRPAVSLFPPNFLSTYLEQKIEHQLGDESFVLTRAMPGFSRLDWLIHLKLLFMNPQWQLCSILYVSVFVMWMISVMMVGELKVLCVITHLTLLLQFSASLIKY